MRYKSYGKLKDVNKFPLFLYTGLYRLFIPKSPVLHSPGTEAHVPRHIGKKSELPGTFQLKIIQTELFKLKIKFLPCLYRF